jgi:hypothetical protein
MLLVGACGNAEVLPPWLVRSYVGVPPGVTYVFLDEAMWTAGGQMAVVTTGSGSCPGLPVGLDVPRSNLLTITVKALDPGPCTADLRATTSIIKVPAALDVSQRVTVTIIDGSYGATVSLPPR